MCFSFPYALSLAPLKEDQSLYKKLRDNNGGKAMNSSQWTQLAVGLHTEFLSLDVQSMVTWCEFRLLEQYQPVGIHIYDISGVKHHFTYHTSPTLGYTTCTFFKWDITFTISPI